MTDRPTVPRRRGRPKTADLGADVGDVGRSGLIEAAKAIFASQDPSKINRRIFAEMAGVDPNLVRYYFGNMRRLMAEVIATTHNQARSQMVGRKGGYSPEERLRFRVQRTFQLFRSQPNHHQMVRAVIYDNPDSKDRLDWETLLHDTVTDLKDILSDGVERGTMRRGVDASSLHLLIVAACEFWTTNEPVVVLLFRSRKTGRGLDKYFVAFLGDFILAALRPGVAPDHTLMPSPHPNAPTISEPPEGASRA